MRAIIFDIEANGTARPQICQLAYIILSDDGVSAHNYYFKVDEMNSYAYKVHGLSMKALDRLSGGRTFADFAAQISQDFYWADVHAGHGVANDIVYLKREFERLGLHFPERRKFCTMHYFTGKFGDATLPSGKPKPPRLSELWEHYGFSEGEIAAFADKIFGGGATAHDARFDAAATYLAIKAGADAGDISIRF